MEAKKLYTNSETIAQALRFMGIDIEVVEVPEQWILGTGYHIVTDDYQNFEKVYGGYYYGMKWFINPCQVD